MRRATRFDLAAVATLSGATALAGPQFFQGLGDLPGDLFESRANEVSADGTTVVGYSLSANGREAFRWTVATGMVGLGDLPGGAFYSVALGVSTDGSVIAGGSANAAADMSSAFRWVLTNPGTGAGVMTDLGDLPGGQTRSESRAVSANGDVIVGVGFSAEGSEAFRWVNPAVGGMGMVGLGTAPGYTQGDATGVSADGAVVVGSASIPAGAFHAARWTAETGMVALGALPGHQVSIALDVNVDGTVVVGQSSTQAFRWLLTDPATGAGVMTGLGQVPGGNAWSTAQGVSADGSVVVGAYSPVETPGPQNQAMIWDTIRGMRNLADVLTSEHGLDLTGWTLRGALGISDDGRTIAGFGNNPAGNLEAWLAHLGPVCPGDLNGDGSVGLQDLSTLLASFGTADGAAYGQGDLDGDGDVDLSDLASLLAHFGTICA